MRMEFHEKLQALRKKRGLTQEELAAALFVSRTAVSKWESGRGYTSIDSLKAIARFYSVTIDELLSGEEVLNLAQEDRQQERNHFEDMLSGLLDSSFALMLILPFFGQRADGAVRAVSLIAVSGVQPYLEAAYWLAVAGCVVMGMVTLALQTCEHPGWIRHKRRASLMLNAAAALLFAVSRQPYAAVFALAVWFVKLCIWMKKR